MYLFYSCEETDEGGSRTPRPHRTLSRSATRGKRVYYTPSQHTFFSSFWNYITVSRHFYLEWLAKPLEVCWHTHWISAYSHFQAFGITLYYISSNRYFYPYFNQTDMHSKIQVWGNTEYSSKEVQKRTKYTNTLQIVGDYGICRVTQGCGWVGLVLLCIFEGTLGNYQELAPLSVCHKCEPSGICNCEVTGGWGNPCHSVKRRGRLSHFLLWACYVINLGHIM